MVWPAPRLQLLRLFSFDAFFTYVYVRMLDTRQMNEFTCSEHSVHIRWSKKRSTGNQSLLYS